MDKLKPCWSCGNNTASMSTKNLADDIRSYPCETPDFCGAVYCLTEDCGARFEGGGFETEEELKAFLVNGWNRRHEVDAIVADLRRMAELSTISVGQRDLLSRAADAYENGETMTQENE